MALEAQRQIPVHLQRTVIEPPSGWTGLNLGELWAYRELLYFLTWRDVKVRYKQAALGFSWAIIQPVAMMLIFTVVFGNFAQLPSDGVPYPAFALAGLLPWQLFSGALTRAGTSLVGNSALLTKVYFPRLLIPLSAVAAGLVDFAVSLVLLFGLLLFFGVGLSWTALTLPLFTLLAIATTVAVGLWLSALNVQYRDVQYVIPFLIQAWMFASPVAYSATLVPTGPWRFVYGLNPMGGVIQGFRWALFGGNPPDELLGLSVLIVVVLLVTGIAHFRRMEATFADVV